MKNGDTSIHTTGLTKEEMEGVGDKFHQGLTKREYAAIKAMQGYIAGITGWSDGLEGGGCSLDYDDCAGEAVKYADALLKALEDK